MLIHIVSAPKFDVTACVNVDVMLATAKFSRLPAVVHKAATSETDPELNQHRCDRLPLILTLPYSKSDRNDISIIDYARHVGLQRSYGCSSSSNAQCSL
jgi:hypothetical protein